MGGPVRSASPLAERGFTLLEVLVAIVILGTAIAATIEASSLTLRTQAAALRQREATAVAEWKMEELATLGPDSLEVLGAGASGEVALATLYRWSVRTAREPGAAVLWRVAVLVEWPGGHVALETLLRRDVAR